MTTGSAGPSTASPPSTSPTRPAILGGSPAVDLPQDDALRWPIITSEDEAAVLRVLRSGELSVSDEVTALEDDYRHWLGVRHAVAHNNGTSAIHAALHAFDLGPGDEVIVPSATWWASVMPVLHQGGVPVFAETEAECLGLDPADVERRLTPRTRAIVVVHLFGMPSRMDEILALARRHDLRVLEDASHAHGAVYRGRKIGTLADAAVFSMQSNKLVPSAEGGMLVTDDDAIEAKAVRYGHYERLLPRTGSAERRFAATGFGHKFRMSPLSAAVARTQLARLETHNERRRDACVYLSHKLETLGFRTHLPPPDVERVYFEFLIGAAGVTGVPLPDLVRALNAEGARVSAPRYPLLHQQPVFTEGTWARIARLEGTAAATRQYAVDDLPGTITGNAAHLRLPCFPRADRGLLDQYATAFEKVLAHADDLPRESA